LCTANAYEKIAANAIDMRIGCLFIAIDVAVVSICC
jgi:hypothetical protein